MSKSSVTTMYIWHICILKYLITIGYLKSSKIQFRIVKCYNVKYNKHIREVNFWKFKMIFTWSRII